MTHDLGDAKVYVTHLRVAVPPADPAAWQLIPLLATQHELRVNGYTPAAKGGLTLVQLEYGDGRTFRGAAQCSTRDNYCKAVGRMIALGRALKAAAEVG